MYNVESTVLAQYANSPIISALVDDFNVWIDPTVNLIQFYNYLWNISTAVGFGLDIWGAILGVNRFLQISADTKQFGFEGGPSTASPFNAAPFSTGPEATSTFALSDTQFRQLLFAKAFANICRTVIPVLNRLLMMVFGDSGVCYVQDNGGMQMTYVFKFTPTPVQNAIIAQSGVLPHPTGVFVNISTT